LGEFNNCPGGYYAVLAGNSDPKLCGGAPVYQQVGEGGGVDGSGPVLFRTYGDGDITTWYVGPSDALATCGDGEVVSYLKSLDYNPGPTSGAPTAPGYSAGDGWYDSDADPDPARGALNPSISVTVGGGGGGGGGGH
jgi:hypothetical protein